MDSSVLEFYLLAIHALKCRGEMASSHWIQIVAKMAEFLKQVVCRNGNLILLGDDDGGQTILLSELRANRFRATLNLAAQLCDRPDLFLESNEPDELLFWIDDPKTKSKSRIKKSDGNKKDFVVFEDAGIAILTDSRDNIERKLVFRSGPFGYGSLAAHGHADALGLVLYVNGKPQIVDPGTFTYFSDSRWRDYFRSTRAHNTVEIDGRNQSEMLGPFIWGRKANGRIEEYGNGSVPEIAASHDGYLSLTEPILHKRIVSHPKQNLWLVRDVLEGKGEHMFRLCWQIPFKELKVEQLKDKDEEGTSVYVISPKESTLQLRLQIRGGSCRAERGWMSESFGTKQEISTVVCERKSHAPVVFTTVISILGAKISSKKLQELTEGGN